MPRIDLVAVITGASSGIGRATAYEFARREAVVVLTARDGDALAEVAAECEGLGGRATYITADMARDQEVQRVARHATAHFGRIDVWVNNAAVYILGNFEELPVDAVRRVIETNIIGYFNGGRAALRQFRRQGRGVLINVDSMSGGAPHPYGSVYVARKYAVRGWSGCLRMELTLADENDIHVCNVMPSAVDTPIFQHAANFTGRPVRALHPTYSATKVAETILALASKPVAEIIVGNAGKAAVSRNASSPRSYERVMARYIDRDHFQEGTAPPTEGNLFRSTGPKAVSGGWNTSGNNGMSLALAAAGVALAVVAYRKLR